MLLGVAVLVLVFTCDGRLAVALFHAGLFIVGLAILWHSFHLGRSLSAGGVSYASGRDRVKGKEVDILSRYREDWWEYTKRIIRSYPALKRKAESVGAQSVTAAYGLSGGHGSGDVGRPVERAVVDRLTDKEQRRYDAVSAAIAETERMNHGRHRLELIRRVYWDQSHTLCGAALCVPISERTAHTWSSEFIRCVEKFLDLP